MSSPKIRTECKTHGNKLQLSVSKTIFMGKSNPQKRMHSLSDDKIWFWFHDFYRFEVNYRLKLEACPPSSTTTFHDLRRGFAVRMADNCHRRGNPSCRLHHVFVEGCSCVEGGSRGKGCLIRECTFLRKGIAYRRISMKSLPHIMILHWPCIQQN